MVIQIELTPLGPGRANLLARKISHMPGTVGLGFMRTNRSWLGLHGQWQATQFWHPMFGAELTDQGLDLTLPPNLVDSIVGVGSEPLQAWLRLDETEHSGTLRVLGQLIGSGGVDPNPRKPKPKPLRDEALELELDLDDMPAPPLPESGPQSPAPTAEPESEPTWPAKQPRRWLPVMILLALVALLGAAAIAWRLGLLEPTEPSAVEEPAPLPAAQGIQLVKEFLATRPTPEAIYERGSEAEQAGDCPAAFALYSEAANREPKLAAELARRYDSITHVHGACIKQPDDAYAITYFRDAAEAGDPSVQLRLGELMLSQEDAGTATRKAALRYIKNAADAGNAKAVERLRQLEP